MFNDLEPYTDLTTPRYVIEMPDDTIHQPYKTRQTAQGMTDPWVDFRMDNNVNEEEASPNQTRKDVKTKDEKDKR